jgi:hypothetical protein
MSGKNEIESLPAACICNTAGPGLSVPRQGAIVVFSHESFWPGIAGCAGLQIAKEGMDTTHALSSNLIIPHCFTRRFLLWIF